MPARTADDYFAAIVASGMDIYAPIDIDDPIHYIPTPILEELLNRGLVGLDLTGAASRTRSKMVKEAACKALGYPVPKSFNKCQPRFTGQDFDTSNQQKLNMQIWNEPIVPTRRYALVRIGADNIVRTVKVVLGEILIPFDRSGKLTTKYQAQVLPGPEKLNLLAQRDTDALMPYLASTSMRSVNDSNPFVSPIDQPKRLSLFSIEEIFHRLAPLVGRSFQDAGRTQDRNRGADLHRMVCQALGYENYQDNGQFPDVLNQLLEVKLQTSPTIDLGLVLPNSLGAVRGVHRLGSIQPRHCDTRYAIFCATVAEGQVTLTHLYLTSGEKFFDHFRQFQGKVQNAKIQLPLPRALFGE